MLRLKTIIYWESISLANIINAENKLIILENVIRILLYYTSIFIVYKSMTSIDPDLVVKYKKPDTRFTSYIRTTKIKY